MPLGQLLGRQLGPESADQREKVVALQIADLDGRTAYGAPPRCRPREPRAQAVEPDADLYPAHAAPRPSAGCH